MFKLHKPHLSGSIHSGHFMVSRLDDDEDDQNDPGDDSSESERDNAQSVEIDVNNPDAVADAAKNLGISYQVQSPSAKSELVTDWNDLDRPAKRLHKPHHQYLTYYTNSHSNLKTEERRRQAAAAAGAAVAGCSQQQQQQQQRDADDDDPSSLVPMDATVPRASTNSASSASGGASTSTSGGRYHQAADDPRGGVTTISGANSLASSMSGLMAAAAAAAAASNNLTAGTTTGTASSQANAHNTAAASASTTQAHLNFPPTQQQAPGSSMSFSYLDADCNKPRDLSNGGVGVLPAEQLAAALQSQHQMIPAAMHTCSHAHAHAVTIDTSLTKLLECMSLYYSSKLTSPKWKSFKGLKLRMKHKIRLNNLIWRAWFLQCIRGRRPPGCQFTAPAEEGVHKKSETHVLEGKYWKRKEKAIVDEYKKWRIFHKQRSQGHYFRPSSFDWDSRASNLVSCGPDEYSFYPDYDMNLSYNLDELPPMLEEELEHCQDQGQGSYYQQPAAVSQSQAQVISSPMGTGGLGGAPMTSTGAAAAAATTATTAATSMSSPHQQQQQIAMTTSAGATLPPAPSLQQQTAISSAQQQQQQSIHQQQLQPITSHPMHQLSSRLEQTHHQQSHSHFSQQQQQQQQMHQNVPMHLNHQTHQQQQYNHQNHLHHHHQQQQQHQALSLKAETQHQIASPQQLTINLANFSAQLPAQKHLQHHQLTHQQQHLTEQQAFALDGANSLHQQLQQQQQHQLNMTHQQQQHQSLNHHHHSQAPVHQAHNQQQQQHHHHQYQQLSTSRHLQQQQQQQLQQHHQPQHVTTDEEDAGQQQTSDQLCYMNQDLMSVSSNASGSSIMSGMGGGGRQEQRRVCHINAEQKRRCNIKNGFDTLRALLPSVNQNVNVKISKASMLQKAAIHINNLSAEQKQQLDEQAILRQQIESLRQSIRTYQAQLPATGVATAGGGGVGGATAGGNPAQSARAREMFQTYVRRRTLDNWKFWIFSYVIEPLYETYYNTVNTNSLEDACKTIYTWLDQNCGMNSLRNDATDSLTLLGTRTSVLTAPETLPGEAVDAAVAAAAAAAAAAANAATTAIGAAAAAAVAGANPTTTTTTNATTATAHSSSASSTASTSVSSPLGGVVALPPQSSDILSSLAANSKAPPPPPHMSTSRPHPHQHQLHPSQLHQQVHQMHAQQQAAVAAAAVVASQQQAAVQQQHQQQQQQQSHNIQRSMW